jgi:hypothetical protein
MNKKNFVTNTAKDALYKIAFTVFGPEEIERSEAQGQEELVASDTLPTDLKDKSSFESLGFVFGEVVENDPLFQYVTLPEGWKKQSTDHSMWSKIVDQDGNERVSIFYKAAFYDRTAFAYLVGH